jgi:hypothetical protein
MSYFDRFDIVEAHYLFCSLYHNGMWSDEYKRLCRITSKLKFIPRPNLCGFESLEENGKEIYADLVRGHYQKQVDSWRNKFCGQPAYVPYFHYECIGSTDTELHSNMTSFIPDDKDMFIFPELMGKDEVVLREVNGNITEFPSQ